MSKGYSDRFITLVKDAKTRIEEITPDEVKAKLDDDNEEDLCCWMCASRTNGINPIFPGLYTLEGAGY